ncbi:MAG: zinc-ribbon domain-containing protein [Clostridia bacterium]|nr:zinc-ribbon domain-containing protein [Clostridia bacterium]
MKICKKCGAVHRDNKVFCADCGEKLPKPLSKEEEAKIEWKNSKTLNKLYDNTDPFVVNIPMKIAAGLNAAAAIFSVLTAIFANTDNKYLVFYALLFHIISFTEALFPEIFWKFSKMEDFFKYENYESLTPSYWWGVSRKFAVWALLIIGTAISVFMLIGE